MDFVYRHFKPWSRYSNRYAQRRGRKDGAKNIPPPDAEEFADYEMELKNLADENIRRIGAAWAREDRILKKDYCQSVSEFEVSKSDAAPARAAYKEIVRENREATAEMGKNYGKIDLLPFIYTMIMALITVHD